MASLFDGSTNHQPRRPHPQLPLFDEGMRQEVERLTYAIQELQAELARTEAERQRVYSQLWEAVSKAAFWEKRAVAAEGVRPVPAARLGDADLKKLLPCAHPDKWSQGQPAAALAHELTVAINRLREGREVQP